MLSTKLVPKSFPWAAVLTIAALLTGAATACDDPVEPTPSQPQVIAEAPVGVGQLPDLAGEVRKATARLNSTTQAIKAGYVPEEECVAVPGLGGMGFHWPNFDRVDPVFEPLEPEVVLYESDDEGNLHLVAIEYIVVNVGQPAPTFDGQAFDVNAAPLPFEHWALHVWLHKENPNGLFTPFNPDVSCE